MPTQAQVIAAFSKAIAIEEGFYATAKVPTIPQRMHNPGDLRSWKKADGTSFEELNGFANFPTCERSGCTNPDHPCEVGWNALRAQCKINIIKRGLTFLEFFQGRPGVYGGYAPARDKNNPQEYAQNVCAYVNRTLGTTATVRSIVRSLIQEQA